MPSKTFPKDLTSYDLLKAVAAIIMVIDHAGYYFFPDDLWFRAIGRIGFPVWFFLVGHARGREIPLRLLIGAGILVAGDMAAGASVFPLNALFTIVFIRLLIDPVMKVALEDARALGAMCLFLFLMVVPSYYVGEYGTQGLIMAMFGYAARHRPRVAGFKDEKSVVMALAVVALLSFVVIQQLIFGFTRPEMLAMFVGTMAVIGVLLSFKPANFPALTGKCPRLIAGTVRFMGRRTMEIYVAHLLLFKGLGMIWDPERFAAFHWHLFPVTG